MYRLACDGQDLLMSRLVHVATDADDYRDRLRATRAERSEQTAGCKMYSVDEWSARDARRTAKAQGWKRHNEERPIYSGSVTMTSHPYDLCPHCAPLADKR